ncbi:MAG TPA: ATP-binding protein [Candidatus Woesebacteria bacterium]|nr:ATP-binding protein [Candidatus Woesebacteria bacterium]
MIKRTILPSLITHLKEKEITLITGPRQVGKTYLMRLIQKNVQSLGKPTLFLNLDINNDRQFFASQESLLARVKLEMGENHGFVFIDEIQRKLDAGFFLKGLYDMDLPYKFIVSGSGSLELKEKIHESLAGRKKIFTVDPVSFYEFVNYRTEYKYEKRLTDFFSVESLVSKQLLEEYLAFGGYPRVVLAQTLARKFDEIKDIYESYVEKDITGLLNVEKPQAFTDLLKVIASQIGCLVNVSEIASTVGISVKTVNSYLWYLEKTYILHKVTPFYQNLRKEITKAPVYYFFDQGLRNYLLGLFALPSIPTALSGHLFENVVFNMLRQTVSPPTTIHFWRTRDSAEVDFVLRTGLSVTPVEVKYKTLVIPEVSRAYRNFINLYKPEKAYYVHLGGDIKGKVSDTEVNHIPYYLVSQALT